jgi:hypothetical protein
VGRRAPASADTHGGAVEGRDQTGTLSAGPWVKDYRIRCGDLKLRRPAYREGCARTTGLWDGLGASGYFLGRQARCSRETNSKSARLESRGVRDPT